MCMLRVAVDRFWSAGDATHYALPDFLDDVMFSHHGSVYGGLSMPLQRRRLLHVAAASRRVLCARSPRGRSLWRTVALWCLYVTEIHCLPVDIRNASLSSGGTGVGSAVNVTCQPGYKINGQTGATLHCSSSGKWTPANRTCQRQWLIISSLCRT